jgi:hypothetical protein
VPERESVPQACHKIAKGSLRQQQARKRASLNHSNHRHHAAVFVIEHVAVEGEVSLDEWVSKIDENGDAAGNGLAPIAALRRH